MHSLVLMMILTGLGAAQQAGKQDMGQYSAAAQRAAIERANEYAANLALISRLTMRRDSLDMRLRTLQQEHRALVEWQRRCQAAPSDCPPPPEPQLPMVGMAPGHAAASAPQVSLAQLQRQRATIARLSAEVDDRTGLAERLERRIAELRRHR